jgi:hypothetical protein
LTSYIALHKESHVKISCTVNIAECLLDEEKSVKEIMALSLSSGTVINQKLSCKHKY